MVPTVAHSAGHGRCMCRPVHTYSDENLEVLLPQDLLSPSEAAATAMVVGAGAGAPAPALPPTNNTAKAERCEATPPSSGPCLSQPRLPPSTHAMPQVPAEDSTAEQQTHAQLHKTSQVLAATKSSRKLHQGEPLQAATSDSSAAVQVLVFRGISSAMSVRVLEGDFESCRIGSVLLNVDSFVAAEGFLRPLGAAVELESLAMRRRIQDWLQGSGTCLGVVPHACSLCATQQIDRNNSVFLSMTCINDARRSRFNANVSSLHASLGIDKRA